MGNESGAVDPIEPELIEGIDDDVDDEEEGPAQSTYSSLEFLQGIVENQFTKKPMRRLPHVIRQALRVVWRTDRKRFLFVAGHLTPYRHRCCGAVARRAQRVRDRVGGPRQR